VSRGILLIEDDDDAREVLQISLEAEGQSVTVAANGDDGIALAAATRPDVVFIDLGLPGLDGFEVARRLRALLGTSVRLIALTGHVRAEDREATAAAGFDGHLTKPIGAEAIIALLAA
jgi:CheY-like chemotaxis protein